MSAPNEIERSPGKATSGRPARQALLEAAAIEFADRGFEGARIERIARRAACNKALVYRYFEDKEGLFRAVLRALFAQRQDLLDRQPEDTARATVHWYRNTVTSEQFLRLLLREALFVSHESGRPPSLVEETARRSYYRAQVARLRETQRRGDLEPAFEPESLFLALLALTTFPGTLPQIASLVTGASPGTPAFDEPWERLLRQLVAQIRGSVAGDGDPSGSD